MIELGWYNRMNVQIILQSSRNVLEHENVLNNLYIVNVKWIPYDIPRMAGLNIIPLKTGKNALYFSQEIETWLWCKLKPWEEVLADLK